MRIIKICLKCGHIQVEDELSNNVCNRCKGSIKNTNYNEDDWLLSMNMEQRKNIRKILRERYVLNPKNTEYDEDEYYKREDEDIQRVMKGHNYRPVPKPNPNACPQCGCTQFTPVRRKWSFITGFMTNKIDMVCNQCGYVKK